jgi:hypothetical protein
MNAAGFVVVKPRVIRQGRRGLAQWVRFVVITNFDT